MRKMAVRSRALDETFIQFEPESSTSFRTRKEVMNSWRTRIYDSFLKALPSGPMFELLPWHADPISKYFQHVFDAN
jgi:hypothetical protein